jgi:3-hydroxybutyrate dehydrogenase
MVHEAVANIVAKTGRSDAEARASVLALAGQPRMLAPEEVAAVALRLASPDGAGTSGQAIMIE